MMYFKTNFVFILIAALIKINYGFENGPTYEDEVDYMLPTTMFPRTYEIWVAANLPTKLINIEEEENYFNFDGTAIITIDVVNETDTIILHKGDINIKIRSVVVENVGQINHTGISWDNVTEKLTIKLVEKLKVNSVVILSIDYEGKLRDDMIGFYKSSYYDANGELHYMAATQFQTTHARHAFPCFDEPKFKAVFKVHLMYRKNYRCMSNAAISNVSETDDPSIKWVTFEDTPKMSTYLVAFVVSTFEEKYNANFNVSVWARPEATVLEHSNFAADIGAKALAVLIERFNQKYHFHKLDMVAVPDFSAGAMENWGIITYRESRLLAGNETPAASLTAIASVIVHEITHMWFGNQVTPDWWSYLWLSEAFARYYQYMGTHQIKPEWNMKDLFIVEQLMAALTVDGIESSKPMTREAYSQEEIGNMGDQITYAKGASIVRMMEYVFGDELFLEAQRTYLKKHAYGGATPENLWSILQELSNQENNKVKLDIKTVMDTWTRQAGFPVINVTLNDGIATIKQERFLIRNLRSTPTNLTWWIPISWNSSSEYFYPSGTNEYAQDWLKSDELIVDTGVNDPGDYVIFNRRKSGFYRVNYDKESWKRIFKFLYSNSFEEIDEVDRVAIVDDLFNLARAGYLDYETALDGLKYLRGERTYLPLKAAINNLQYLIRRFAGDKDEALFKDFVVGLTRINYDSLTSISEEFYSYWQKLLAQELTTLLCKLDYIGCVEPAEKRWRDWLNDKVDMIRPVDQKQAVLCTAVRKNANSDQWELMWERSKQSKLATDQLIILNGLACTKNLTLVERLLDYAIAGYADSRIRLQDSASVFSAVYSSSLESARYILEYTEKKHKEMKEYFGGYGTVSSILSGASQYFSTPELIDEYENFIERNAKIFTSIRSSLNASLELAKYELEWHKQNRESIVKWIKKFNNETTGSSGIPKPIKPAASNFRLPTDILPINYTISIVPYMNSKFFQGEVLINADVKVATDRIVLHSSETNIIDHINVLLDGEQIEIQNVMSSSSKNDFFTLRFAKKFPARRSLQILIKYRGTMEDDEMRGLYRSRSWTSEEYNVIVTHLEPLGARKVFPCFDEPAMKAEFVLKVNADSIYTVRSNMPVESYSSVVNNRKWTHFKKTPKMSTYLLAFVVSKLECETQPMTGHPILQEYSVCSKIMEKNHYAIKEIKKFISSYEDRLGIKYGLPKIDLIALPDFPSGAMENWGLLTFKETNLMLNESLEDSTANAQQTITNVISHEIAHQWFGNLVTMSWWSDLWLNEGFARFFQYYDNEIGDSDWDLRTQFIADQMHSALATDSLTSSHPLSTEIKTSLKIRGMFDTITYAKGASIIRMLYHISGSELFYSALSNYLNSRKYDTAVPEMLFDEFQKLIEPSVFPFSVKETMKPWITQAGYPVVHISTNGSKIHLKQERFYLRSNDDEVHALNLPWNVPIAVNSYRSSDYYTIQESRDPTDPLKINYWLTNSEDSFDLPEFNNKDIFIFNYNRYGFFRVNYDREYWLKIIKVLKTYFLPLEGNRAAIIDDLFNLARAGYVEYDIVLSVFDALKQETSFEYSPWKTFTDNLKYLHNRFSGRDIYNNYKTHVMKVITPFYKKLGLSVEIPTNIDHHIPKLLKSLIFEWACKLDDSKETNCVDLSMKHFVNALNGAGFYSIPVTIRSTVYCTAIKYGRANYWDALFEHYVKETDVNEKMISLKALGCSERRSQLQELLTMAIKRNSVIRRQDSKVVFKSVYDSGLVGLKYTMTFLSEFYENMYEYYGDDKQIKSYLNGISSRISTLENYKQLQKTVEAIADKAHGVSRPFDFDTTRATYELNWFDTYAPSILYWLNTTYPSYNYRLSTVISPLTYDIKITDFYGESNTFRGSVKIDMIASEDTSFIDLNAYKLNISNINVNVNNRSVKILGHDYNEKYQKLVVYMNETMKRRQKFSIEISYTGFVNDDMKGFYRSSYIDSATGKKRWVYTTQFEPTHARQAFPCFDEPSFKATFLITLESAPTQKVLSNMPLLKSTEIIYNKTKRVHRHQFKETTKMSTYLVAFVISEYKTKELENVRISGRPDIINYGEYALQTGRQALDVITEYIAHVYSLPKLDLVGVPDFSGGAMENWGLAIFREYGLFMNETDTPAYRKQYINTLITHELVHMWFGNLVTCDWWDHIWLHEGFAEYLQWVISHTIEPKWRLLDQFQVNELQIALQHDKYSSTRPMNHPVFTPSEIKSSFDTVAYAKSASVLRMLEYALGQRVFKLSLFRYISDSQFGNANPDYLADKIVESIKSLNDTKTMNLPIHLILHSWTDNKGYPVVHARRTYDVIAISQTNRFKPNTGIFSVFWVPITTATQLMPAFNETSEIMWLTSQPLTFYIEPEDEWFMVNVQQTGYYRVNYNRDNWYTLMHVIMNNRTVIPEANRAQFVDDILNLVQDDYVDVQLAFNATRIMLREDSYIPWKAFFNGIAFYSERVRDMPIETNFTFYMSNLTNIALKDLGFEDKANDSHLVKMNRELIGKWACRYDNPYCVSASTILFKKWRTNPANRVSPNARYAVYCTALRHGNTVDWKFLWDEYLKTVLDSEKITMLNALGCSENKVVLEYYLYEAVYNNTIKKQYVVNVFSAISSHTTGLNIAFDFIWNNYRDIYDLYGNWGGLADIASRLVQQMTLKNQIEQFSLFIFANKESFPEIVSQLEEARDIALANYNWYQNNKVALHEAITNTTEYVVRDSKGSATCTELSMLLMFFVSLFYILRTTS